MPLGVQRSGSPKEMRPVPLVVQGRNALGQAARVVPLGVQARDSQRQGDRSLVPLVVQASEDIATTPLGHVVVTPTPSLR